MSLERTVLISTWILIFILLLFFVPKDKRRDAAFIFLAGQVISWSISHLLVELKWVENPVREFPKASGCNFTFNYALYPTFHVMFCLHYPQKKKSWIKIAYNFILPALTIPFFYFVGEYTDLIELIKANLFTGYFLLIVSSFAILKYYEWFFKHLRKEGFQ